MDKLGLYGQVQTLYKSSGLIEGQEPRQAPYVHTYIYEWTKEWLPAIPLKWRDKKICKTAKIRRNNIKFLSWAKHI